MQNQKFSFYYVWVLSHTEGRTLIICSLHLILLNSASHRGLDGWGMWFIW